MGKKDFNLEPIIANIDAVKKRKASKEKKPSTSIKPLKFDINPDDSPLKAEIIRIINERDLTYADIYNYCAKLNGGDYREGQTQGYNIIFGLKTRPSMMDTTFSMLCDFLGLSIQLVAREPGEDDEDEDEE